MITILKPADVPEELIKIQKVIAKQLFLKKEKFKWETKHYSEPIKEELKSLYNNKCGFCEIELSEQDTDNKFTVEHFRPKSDYYWLGAEWTNLFPTCKACNNNKKNDFPLFQNKYKQQNAPFNKEGVLIKDKCKANCVDLLNEKPLFIHPEISDPKVYFVFEPSGKVRINEKNNKFEQEQARLMINKFLGRPSIEEKRKRKIIFYQNKLRDILIISMKELGSEYKERDVYLLFYSFFNELFNQQKKEAEFSLLGFYMIKDFDVFFLDKIEKDYNVDLRKLVEYAYNLLYARLICLPEKKTT